MYGLSGPNNHIIIHPATIAKILDFVKQHFYLAELPIPFDLITK
jgi:hypothetical protein